MNQVQQKNKILGFLDNMKKAANKNQSDSNSSNNEEMHLEVEMGQKMKLHFRPAFAGNLLISPVFLTFYLKFHKENR